MRLRAILLMVSFLVLCARARSQELVYSLSYVETLPSYHARFPNPLPFGRTPAENLAMLRQTRKTEVHSVSVVDGRGRLLFSDVGSVNLELAATGSVSPAGKAYIPGTWREEPATSGRGVIVDHGIYAIDLDGSNRFRKVAEVGPRLSPPILNRQGTRAAFVTFRNGEYVVSIYALPGWNLVDSWSLSQLTSAHCPTCDTLSYGWLADGRRLYFELGLVGEDQTDHPEARDTSYIVSQEGADLGPLPQQVAAVQLPGYVSPPLLDRHFLGQLPGGSYLFQIYAVRKGQPLWNVNPFLVVFNSAANTRKQFHLKAGMARGFLSPSGRYFAYIEDRRTPEHGPVQHLWVMDLESGAASELFAAPPPNPPSSPQPNVFLTILGWLRKN